MQNGSRTKVNRKKNLFYGYNTKFFAPKFKIIAKFFFGLFSAKNKNFAKYYLCFFPAIYSCFKSIHVCPVYH